MTWVICLEYGAEDRARCWAFMTRVAAMSSIALVIFLVFWTLVMRRRRTRSLPPAMTNSHCSRHARLKHYAGAHGTVGSDS